MTSTEPTTAPAHGPVDAVVERLNDPAVAASLVTLLDNAELLSTLVIGLSSLIERSETIVDSVAESVHEFKSVGGSLKPEGAPSLKELGTVAGELASAGPALSAVLNSKMVEPETIELLSTVSEAATEGAQRARATGASVGVLGMAKAMRDPDVQRGLGMVIEIARSLGRRMG